MRMALLIFTVIQYLNDENICYCTEFFLPNTACKYIITNNKMLRYYIYRKKYICCNFWLMRLIKKYLQAAACSLLRFNAANRSSLLLNGLRMPPFNFLGGSVVELGSAGASSAISSSSSSATSSSCHTKLHYTDAYA